VKPFYPFDYMVNGVTDAWEWPLQWMAVSWAVLIAMGMGIRLARRRKCG
jgi:hypothetical protein